MSELRTDELRTRELRAYVFRKKASDAETKAFSAELTEPTRRAWLIIAREWTRMAEKEEAEADAPPAR